jgi:hypothetical protein
VTKGCASHNQHKGRASMDNYRAQLLKAVSDLGAYR